MGFELLHAPHFGVFHLSLHDAGLLIAKCLWFRGELSAKIPAKDSYSFHDPDIAKALTKPAAEFTEHLVTAITEKSLSAQRIQRDVAGIIDKEQTFIEALTLAHWLEDRGVFLGEVFDDEYLAEESALARKAATTIAAERHRRTHSEKLTETDLTQGAEVLFLRHRIAELEQQIHSARAPSTHHAPITEKQRGAYLNIIGALLGVLLGQSPAGVPYSKFDTQQAVIDAIHGTFGEAPGLSQRNLVDKFAQGKRALLSTQKD